MSLKSPDDLDETLYESGEPVRANKNVQKKDKSKLESSKRPRLNSMQPQELSDYIISSLKKNKTFSLLELEDLRPPSYALSSFEHGDGTKLFECISHNFNDNIKSLQQSTSEMKILVLSSSAIRATELIRQLGNLRQQCGVGKCFAKHFKIEEQIKFFDSKRPGISIGTPNRLLKLFSSGHSYFDIDTVKLCIIDTNRDQKQRNIFEIPETCSDLLNFYVSLLFPALKSGNMKLVFF